MGLKSFIPRLFCSTCNEDITSDEEFVICKKSETMPLTSNYKTKTTVKFTDLIGNGRLVLREHFKLNATLELANARCKIRNFI